MEVPSLSRKYPAEARMACAGHQNLPGGYGCLTKARKATRTVVSVRTEYYCQEIPLFLPMRTMLRWKAAGRDGVPIRAFLGQHVPRLPVFDLHKPDGLARLACGARCPVLQLWRSLCAVLENNRDNTHTPRFTHTAFFSQPMTYYTYGDAFHLLLSRLDVLLACHRRLESWNSEETLSMLQVCSYFTNVR